MSADARREVTEDAPAASLTKALDKSERVKEIVEECAEDLSSVNQALTQELAGPDVPPRVSLAIEKSGVVEGKVQDASDQLDIVNAALKIEVKERHALQDRLTALSEQSEADRHASFHDPLTGLPNRALFDDRFEQGLAQANRHGWALAVMFVDLDNFKAINDVHGHEAGDIVLKIVSDRLSRVTRRDDTICRHGGDEFIYLLAEINEEADAVMIVEKLILAIQEPCVVDLLNKRIAVEMGASVGIAFAPKHGIDAESLLRHADGAMYEAKRSKSGYSIAPTNPGST